MVSRTLSIRVFFVLLVSILFVSPLPTLENSRFFGVVVVPKSLGVYVFLHGRFSCFCDGAARFPVSRLPLLLLHYNKKSYVFSRKQATRGGQTSMLTSMFSKHR